ncbi:family 43 glycosylhydrolase [Fibrella forsythiae]|uniref:family 43 glycosylhydrolase n=1 Tax=Fibrella forsythiae TaxID=2817061 RepID=UPI00286E15F8|nr:family 43 glycosylhydrolase [Fibrella forsythiae]
MGFGLPLCDTTRTNFTSNPDPDFGIYLTKATNPAGPWSAPVLVEAGKGLIDPCPLWDDDGQTYLVHG